MTTQEWMRVPSTCTLQANEQPTRLTEIETAFSDWLVRSLRTSPTTATFTFAPGSAARARELAMQEASCCSFFSFEIHETGENVEINVSVPITHAAVLDALLISTTGAISTAEIISTTGGNGNDSCDSGENRA